MANSVSQNLIRLQNARTAIANKITSLGGTVSQNDGFEEFPNDLDTIPSGYSLVTGSASVQGTGTTLLTPTYVYAIPELNMMFGMIKVQIPKNKSGTIAYITGIDFPSNPSSSEIYIQNGLNPSFYFSNGSIYNSYSVSSVTTATNIFLIRWTP